jgi:hypothetical protein
VIGLTRHGDVLLSVKDPTVQDLLWQVAQRCRKEDGKLAEELESALLTAGYQPSHLHIGDKVLHRKSSFMGVVGWFAHDGTTDFFDENGTGPYKQAEFDVVLRAVP